MDIRRLTHFIALAEEGRFARAAERVHLSQAAFSRSIQALEQQLGLRLFDRAPRGAELTRVGEVVLQRARALVFDSGCLQRDIELVKHGDAGELWLGAAPVPAALIMPQLLHRLRSDHPGLLTRVRFGNLPALIELLDSQALDFCLGEPGLIGNHDRYAMAEVGIQRGALFCRTGHPLARKAVADADALRRYGVALISTTPLFLDRVAAAYGFASGREFPLALECDDINLLARLVADSDTLAVLPQGLAHTGHRLRSLHFEGAAAVQVNVHAIWLKGRTLSPAATHALALARLIGGPSGSRSAPKPLPRPPRRA